MGVIKIEAVKRLKAVQIIPDVYSDARGLQDLANVQKLFNSNRRKIGVDKRGFTFWWVGSGQNTLVCSKDREVLGFIDLRRRPETIEVDGRDLRVRAVNVMFLHPDYRSLGLILGMHQYLITQVNLLSDDTYSPEGLKVWHKLKALGHKVEVIDASGDDSKNWESWHTILLIRRNQ